MNMTPLNIGQTPQFFFDNHVIEMVNFVTRRLHSPKRSDRNPILKRDKPWEKVPFWRTNTWNVHWDTTEQLFKSWYEDLGWDYKAFMNRENASSARRILETAAIESYEQTIDNRLLYAESQDGLHWEKPKLDYRTINGQRTNICFGNEEHGKIHACSILLDPFEHQETHRFKAIYWTSKKGLGDSRISIAHSSDGRRWIPYDQPLRIGQIAERQLGDVIILSADTSTAQYHLDTRSRAMQEPSLNPEHPRVRGWGPAFYPHDPWRMSKRRIFSSVTRDFTNWPLLQEMLVPDDTEDNLDDEFYGLVRFRMGDLHVALLNIFHRTDNTLNIHLVYSRDGYHWHRVDRSQPCLDVGPPGAWDCYMTEVCNTPLFLEDEIRIYYGGSNLHHDWWMFGEREGLEVPEARPGWNGGETALGVATLRPEGFVSIDSTAREGILATHPFISDGFHLVVNVQCQKNGYLEVELANADDQVIAGYDRSACDTIQTDSSKHRVSWQGRHELPLAILSKGAKLRFYSRHCSLYSFSLVDGRNIAEKLG